MALSHIRTAITSTITGAGIEIVYPYLRWATDRKTFLTLFKTDSNLINGWMHSRMETPSERAPKPLVTRKHTFRLIGLYGLNDADGSEVTFQTQVETVQGAFDNAHNLGGCTGVQLSGPADVKVVENRIFAGHLCHFAELILPVIERRQYE